MSKTCFAKNIFTKTESAQIIETLFEIVKQTLEPAKTCSSVDSANSASRRRIQRRGRNPQTGDPIMLSPRKVVQVTFKCSGVLRERINVGMDWGDASNPQMSSPREIQLRLAGERLKYHDRFLYMSAWGFGLPFPNSVGPRSNPARQNENSLVTSLAQTSSQSHRCRED